MAEGERLRIRHQGFYVADVPNVYDLARWIPAAELAQLERDTLILATGDALARGQVQACRATIHDNFVMISGTWHDQC